MHLFPETKLAVQMKKDEKGMKPRKPVPFAGTFLC